MTQVHQTAHEDLNICRDKSTEVDGRLQEYCQVGRSKVS